MQAMLAGRAVVIVLLDSWGKYTRTADVVRVRKWMEVAAGYAAPAPVRSNVRKAPVKAARAAASPPKRNGSNSGQKVTVRAAARKPAL
jgi:hypothetical protein